MVHRKSKSMRFLIIFVLLLQFNSFAQERIQSLDIDTKMQLYSENKVHFGSFWPQIGSRESLLTKKRVNFSFSKNYLVTIEDSNQLVLEITPLFNVSVGQEISTNIKNSIYQNTRGFYARGSFTNRLLFETGFLENQARFSSWQTDYYKSIGENRVIEKIDGSLDTLTINASIPGAARTKPFGNNAFDYAFAWGQLVLKPTSKLSFALGNSPQFIGAGIRSQLLSDNIAMAPFIRTEWRIFSKFKYTAQLMKVNDLFRKRYYSTIEAPFQKKTMMFHYISYQISRKMNISLFDGVLQNRESENRTITPSWQVAIPVPLIGTLSANNEQQHTTLIGFNAELQAHKWLLLYSQGTLRGKKLLEKSLQIGARIFFKRNKFQFHQIFEGNFYSKKHQRDFAKWSHGNTVMTGIQNAEMNEIIANGSIQFNKWYANYHVSAFLRNDQLHRSNFQGELGFCWNRSYNGCLFVRAVRRNQIEPAGKLIGNAISVGIKASVLNAYTSF
jgi:hypothetical protein